MDNSISREWVRQLENASARVHISRLDAVKLDIQHAAERIFGNQLDNLTDLAKREFLDAYNRSMFEIQNGFNIGWDIAGVSERKLEAVINRPWTTDNMTFSDRIWRDKRRLAGELQNTLTQSVMLGRTSNETIQAFADKMGTTYNNARRLVVTEMSYISALAEEEAYKEAGVEFYKISATLDKLTSEICEEMDGKIFPLREFQPGVTANPFHPHCRTTTVPHFDDEFSHFFNDGERAARDEDGKTYYVPNDMTYPEWKKTFAEGGSKKGLTNLSRGDIIQSDGGIMDVLPNADKAVIPVDKFVKYALDTTHPTGKHKAYVFRDVLGYTLSNARILIAKVQDGIDKFPASFIGTDAFGHKYEVVMQIEGANGRAAQVVTGWIIEYGTDAPRLISAYIPKKR